MSEFYHGLKEAAGVAEIISRLQASFQPDVVTDWKQVREARLQ
jgi:hypothetical protein